MKSGRSILWLNTHLLKLLVDKVDADLFKRVEFEDLEAGDVEHADEGDLRKSYSTDSKRFHLLHRWVNQRHVAHVDNVTEETTIDVLDDRAGADLARVGVLRLAHPLRSDLSIPFSSMKMMTSSHLVFRVDEGVIDALGAVAEVEDGVDLLSTIQRLRGGNLTHALGI